MDTRRKITIGSRGSRLALIQSNQVRDIIKEQNPGIDCEIRVIKTAGDKILDAPLSKIGDKGLFTKEIEKELLGGAVDLAVHSMKDMPTELPGGCVIGAITARIDPRDVFISRNGKSLADLREGDIVATGSLRRKAQLLAFRPGLEIIDIRGNVQSRLNKMRGDPRIEGTLLALSGLDRLGMRDTASEIISESTILPAVGQGSLAVEIRRDDGDIDEIISALDDRDARDEVICERAFLTALGGGCQVPIAGLARVAGNTITFTGLVASLDGSTVLRETSSGTRDESARIGSSVAEILIRRGGSKILDEIYGGAC
jgi:hydroxymethylbilane synthase